MDIIKIREQFPILQTNFQSKVLVYLDNAATTLKSIKVSKVINDFYLYQNANVHRGAHFLSGRATEYFEESRKSVQRFINAKKSEEIIFTGGTTESINLVASSFGEKFFFPGDEIIISEMEHHSNIVPWQNLCSKKKLKLKIIPINDKGEIIFSAYQNLLSEKTKLVAITHVSNVLGSINNIKEIINYAHKYKAKVLIDAAQSVSNQKIDVQDIDVDFLAFSGHKMFGPFGVGVLYGKEDILEEMDPYQFGGGMIDLVTWNKTTFLDLPHKLEAGTPNIPGVIALKYAIEFINEIGLSEIYKHENKILQETNKLINQLSFIKVIGSSNDSLKSTSIVSFLMNGVHPSDVGSILNQENIAVRTGHHCAQPLMQRFGINGTVRASFSVYNTLEEVHIFVDALKKAKELLS